MIQPLFFLCGRIQASIDAVFLTMVFYQDQIQNIAICKAVADTAVSFFCPDSSIMYWFFSRPDTL
ncbi:MAG: hypothetical protein ACOX7X_06485 [Methanosarcina flavescens]|uniref:Uncharacterized protein n=1 Tax=Methanosarcina flavescens TaxID=1715806 RepID=A0A7K4AU15_9EURY|nr:hypothetical protein [Methanosarcina flavescens]NLK32176.1 hypothetical protein [Methanosarcina flavescens]